MTFGISEMIATIYNCHKGHMLHGETESEGTFGKATTIDEKYRCFGDVRVELKEPSLTVIISEGEYGYSAAFKGYVAKDKDLEEAIFEAVDAGKGFSVTKF